MGSETIVIPAIGIFFYMVIKTISNNKLRKHLADRAIKGEDLKSLFSEIDQSSRVGLSSFKIGLFLTVIGIDLLIIDQFNLYNEMAFAVFFISGGLVLLISDKLEESMNK